MLHCHGHFISNKAVSISCKSQVRQFQPLPADYYFQGFSIKDNYSKLLLLRLTLMITQYSIQLSSRKTRSYFAILCPSPLQTLFQFQNTRNNYVMMSLAYGEEFKEKFSYKTK